MRLVDRHMAHGKPNEARSNERLTCDVCGYIANTVVHLQEHLRGHQIKCDMCNVVFKTMGLVRRHMEQEHHGHTGERIQRGTESEYTIKCTMCDFMAKSNIQIQKHMKVRHEEDFEINQECRYWRRGNCVRGQQCKFLHGERPACRHGLQCRFWPNCFFSHQNVKPCRFQEYCQNNACTFAHFLGARINMQPPPHLNSYQEFPPLNREDSLWRPW